MYAEMNNQCPDEPWLEENCALSLWFHVGQYFIYNFAK